MFESRNGRTIDANKPVKVYRNLHRNGPHGEPIYSIQQSGLVVGYAPEFVLHRVKFVVQKAGQAKVRATGKKVVHAFMTGLPVGGWVSIARPELMRSGTYNPYRNDTFVDRETGVELTFASIAKVGANGVQYYNQLV